MEQIRNLNIEDPNYAEYNELISNFLENKVQSSLSQDIINACKFAAPLFKVKPSYNPP